MIEEGTKVLVTVEGRVVSIDEKMVDSYEVSLENQDGNLIWVNVEDLESIDTNF